MTVLKGTVSNDLVQFESDSFSPILLLGDSDLIQLTIKAKNIEDV